jgi:2-keto-4-pentenoate hydratase/2-oxohepta-3-ene-1,7-dioic acid hydratase in catechol pathway
MDKIVCFGKNYLEHARELGDAIPEKPVVFLKPPSVLKEARGAPSRDVGEITDVRLPQAQGEVHHECEIVFRLDDALKPEAITVGLDLTLRGLQNTLKQAGHPWTIAKVFEDAAVVGPWVSVWSFPEWRQTPFEMELGQKVVQRGTAREMTFQIEELIEQARACFPLCEGDLLFTGTPAGVGPLSPGQVAELRFGPIRYRVRFTNSRGQVC